MIYVISGARRTGTSMLMQAIYKGTKTLGLMVADIEAWAYLVDHKRTDGYHPNPNGAYEVGTMAYQEPAFLRSIPPSSLIKILFDGLPILPRGEYKIIFMERDVEEIRASIKRVKEYLKDGDTTSEELTKYLPFSCFRPYNQVEIDHVKGICEARSDIDLTVVNYNDVINDPLKEFSRLQALGWPIIPGVCAGTIDEKLYRSRNGHL